MYYFIRENGNGAYCIANSLEDGVYNDECIMVPEKPSISHRWDNVAKEWTLSLQDKQNEIRRLRNPELTRTDKYMLNDYNLAFSIEEQAEIVAYRQALRDAPSKSSIEELVMPECPTCIQA